MKREKVLYIYRKNKIYIFEKKQGKNLGSAKFKMKIKNDYDKGIQILSQHSILYFFLVGPK